jgi:Ion channel
VGGSLGWVVSAAGAVLVLVALRDIFWTIWHPGGRGGLTRRLMLGIWTLGRSGRHRRWLHQLSGPVAMVTVVFVWLTMILLGWALVYWPHLSTGFLYSTGLDPESHDGLSDALYLSAVTLGTLGFGDISPVDTWLRMAVPVEALVGFGLISASVSWVLEVYPAITRRRSLAVRLAHLDAAGTRGLLRGPVSSVAPGLLLDLSSVIAQLRSDLTQYAETYYFRDNDAEASLPAMFSVALDLAEEAGRSADPDLRYAGRLLAVSAEDYLRVIDRLFLGSGGSAREICAAYAGDHRHEAATAP